MSTNAAVTASARPFTADRDDVLPIIEGVLIPRTRFAIAAFVPAAIATVIYGFLYAVSDRGPTPWNLPDPTTVGVLTGLVAGMLVLFRFIGASQPILTLGSVALLYGAGFVHCVTDQTQFNMPLAVGQAAMLGVMLYGLVSRIRALRLARAAGIDLEALDRGAKD